MSVVSPAVKVSVVVPVYNPGRYIGPNIDSLLGQSLPPDEYEIIYVDDGSTDDTPKLLDDLAARHRHVRVHHQPNSGWPGKPRNVGVDLARGEYVQFVDQDDELTSQALERLYALASANRSDIVLSKVTGSMAGPSNVFRRTVESCDIRSFPLNESLTPHKLFRREFLRENDLRFAEGKRRLEDQLFMIQAYLAAKNVSILGDHPCYVWHRRDDGRNTSSGYTHPRDYFANLREVLDAIVAGTEPGELRNRLLRRHYRVEMLARVREPSILRYSPQRRRDAFEVVRELASERFGSGEVQAGLAPVARLRAHLLEQGHLDALVRLAERCDGIRGRSRLDALTWQDGRLVADVHLELVHGDGTPVAIERRGGRWILDRRLTTGLPGMADGWDVGDPLEHVQAEARVYDRDHQLWWFADDTLHGALLSHGSSCRVVVRGTVTIDPSTLAGGQPMPRSLYDIWLSFQVLGIGRGPRLGANRSSSCDLRPALVGDEPLIVAPYWTAVGGNLSLDVGGRGGTFLGELAVSGLRIPRSPRHRIPRQRGEAPLPAAATEIPVPIATNGDAALPIGVAVPGLDEPLRAEIRSDGNAGAVLALPVRSRRFTLSLLGVDGEPTGPEVRVASTRWAAMYRRLRRSSVVRRIARGVVTLALSSVLVRRLGRALLARLPRAKADRLRAFVARL